MSQRNLIDYANDSQQLNYGRRIRLLSLAFGAVGFVLGGILLILMALRSSPGSPTSLGSYIAGLIFVTAVFSGMGLGFACLFAPRKFLEGPGGQWLLAKVGVKSIIAARITCIAYLLFVGAILTLGVYFAFSD